MKVDELKEEPPAQKVSDMMFQEEGTECVCVWVASNGIQNLPYGKSKVLHHTPKAMMQVGLGEGVGMRSYKNMTYVFPLLCPLVERIFPPQYSDQRGHQQTLT